MAINAAAPLFKTEASHLETWFKEGAIARYMLVDDIWELWNHEGLGRVVSCCWPRQYGYITSVSSGLSVRVTVRVDILLTSISLTIIPDQVADSTSELKVTKTSSNATDGNRRRAGTSAISLAAMLITWLVEWSVRGIAGLCRSPATYPVHKVVGATGAFFISKLLICICGLLRSLLYKINNL